MAGWDECAPTITACRVDGRDIPDHGDLWDSRFTIDGPIATGFGDGYRFQRAIAPTPSGLSLSYRAEASRDMPFLWAAHPQFAAPAGTRIALPDDVRDVIEVSLPNPQRREWTAEAASIDSLATGRSRKFYLAPDAHVAAAAIVRPDSSALRLTWSRNCPYLGLWLDNAEFNANPVIALEPSTGFYDSLEQANRNSRVSRIGPGRHLSWRLDIDYVEPGAEIFSTS
jgi:galactose mutarotase-like enzyme